MIRKSLFGTINLFLILSMGCSPRPIKTKPNVILISIDALKADHLSCYGYKRNTTPNIDKLASEGVLFSQAISHAAGTLASHMSMLTSLYPHTHGVDHGHEVLPDSKITLAEILKENGYFTMAFTGGGYMDAEYGFNQGFDIYDDSGGEIEKQIPKIFNFLERNRNKKFFIFIHIYDVHAPYNPPEPYSKLYTLFNSDFNPSIDNLLSVNDKKITLTDDDLQHIIALYDGGIRYVDEHIGKLLNKLDELSLTDKTIIILTSDHGEEFMEHGSLLHPGGFYDVLLHVPLIMKLKGHIKEGIIINNQVQSIDIMPTILDILGISLNKEAEGRSLFPLIMGKQIPERNAYSECLAWEAFGLNMYSVRTERFKYLYTISKTEGFSEELYNLKNDPNELVNLISEKPEVAIDLKNDLLECIGSFERPFSKASKAEISEKTKRRLKSLGYLQ